MEALKVIYTTKDSAFSGIKEKILSFYNKNHPDVYSKFEKEIKGSITLIQEAFAQNTFPEMKVRYNKYPRNIGHLENNGCFRCHDGNHKSSDGQVISNSCNLCHTIVGQGKKDAMTYSPINGNLEFIHPTDVGEDWKTTKCSECHNELF